MNKNNYIQMVELEIKTKCTKNSKILTDLRFESLFISYVRFVIRETVAIFL